MLIQQIIYGILIIAAGVLMLKFNYQLVGFTGRQDWIESKLGSGTTYLAYKILAVVIIIGGILYMTGLGGPLANQLLSPLSKLFHPPQ